jgi:hypothetical protein
MEELSAFADSLRSITSSTKKESSWKPTLPPPTSEGKQKNSLEELNSLLTQKLSESPCDQAAVDNLLDQIRELEELDLCFNIKKVQAASERAVLAAESAKIVRISEAPEVKEYEAEKITRSTSTRLPLTVETPKTTVVPFKHPVDLDESENEFPSPFSILSDKKNCLRR